MKKYFKGILFYVTLFYALALLLLTESFTSIYIVLIGWLILLFLVISNVKLISVEELRDFIPKWFK